MSMRSLRLRREGDVSYLYGPQRLSLHENEGRRRVWHQPINLACLVVSFLINKGASGAESDTTCDKYNLLVCPIGRKRRMIIGYHASYARAGSTPSVAK